MFSGKSRPHPTNQESNTLLWPVDLRFLVLFDADGSLQMNIHPALLSLSVFLSFPQGPRLEHMLWVPSLQSLSPQQALCCMTCLLWGDSPAPGSIAQIPAWVYFKASSLCTVHWLIFPSLPPGRASIMPLTTSFPPAFFFFRNLMNVRLARKRDSQFPRTKILGFFGTKK